MPVFLRSFLRLWATNPIAVRLVQNGSRRTKHMYVRSIYLAVLIVVLLYALLAYGGMGDHGYRDLAAAGAAAFTVTAYLQVALICVIAPVFMAGAIAQESDPKTWDILLTTPLGKLQIVLGNLFGRLFFVLALLFCSLPLFAVTQYFGGVPGTSIFASYLIAGCSAVLVGAIAIALSVSRLVGRRAVFAFYIAVLSYIGVTGALDRILGGGGRVTHFTALNPFLAMRSLLEPTAYPRWDASALSGIDAFFLARPVAAWCVLSLGISLALVLASTLTVRSGGLASIAGGRRAGIPWHRRLLGLGASGSEHRPPRPVGNNPIAWREATARNATLGRILARWSFIAVGMLWALAGVILYHTGSVGHETFRLIVLSTVWTESAVVALIAMNMAATAISREREDGTLDLLLTTPITPAMYLAGKLRGLVAYLLPLLAVPIGTLLLGGLYVLADGLGRQGGVHVAQHVGQGVTLQIPVLLPEGGLVAAGVLVPFIAFCVMVGLQWSLKSKGTIGSVVATVGVVGVVGGILSTCGLLSAQDIAAVGPALAALSPASVLYAVAEPYGAMRESIEHTGLDRSRISLAIGSGVAAGVYLAVVYGTHAAMVRNFDFTVRKLAGTR